MKPAHVWRTALFCLVAGWAFASTANELGQCTYVLGLCVSCEKPLTCETSRPAGASAPIMGKGASVSTIAPAPKRAIRPPSESQTQRPARAKTSVVRTSPRKTVDREFEQFKTYMRSKGQGGKAASEADLRKLYARYKTWSAAEKRK
ncbi:MAG: hypothetical protein R3D67_04220 [Hyphomicrobiaceae bacterium]